MLMISGHSRDVATVRIYARLALSFVPCEAPNLPLFLYSYLTEQPGYDPKSRHRSFYLAEVAEPPQSRTRSASKASLSPSTKSHRSSQYGTPPIPEITPPPLPEKKPSTSDDSVPQEERFHSKHGRKHHSFNADEVPYPLSYDQHIIDVYVPHPLSGGFQTLNIVISEKG